MRYAWTGGIDHDTRVGSVVVSLPASRNPIQPAEGQMCPIYLFLGAVTSLSGPSYTLLMELCLSWVLKRSKRAICATHLFRLIRVVDTSDGCKASCTYVVPRIQTSKGKPILAWTVDRPRVQRPETNLCVR